MDMRKTMAYAEAAWDRSILPALQEYIRIPNESPAFDPQWRKHGHMDRAVELAERWVRERKVAGMTIEVIRLPERTPVLLLEVPGRVDDTVLLYGHLDKQPPMDGWSEGLGAWTPVVRGDKLYGRGGADDGYATFASVAAIQALHEQGAPHARLVVLIECGEESGSPDLPHYIEHLKERIGKPSLVVCLDSGCADYDRLWMTTSLRGMIGGTLRVSVLREGVHSGDASGVVPSSFRILRKLLGRLEDLETGTIHPTELWAPIPAIRKAQAETAAKLLGASVYTKFPLLEGMRPVSEDPRELLLNRTWRPQLAVTGIDGLPPLERAGNVLRPTTAVRLSLRLPPGVNPERAERRVKELLERTPPYGTKVSFDPDQRAAGWDAPALAPWLEEIVAKASKGFFNGEAGFMGEGGTIPFMAMLGERFPAAQFVVTGLLGPASNAHGPNEFLHIPTAKRLTASIAHVLAAHANAPRT